MEMQYFKEYSPELGRDMECKLYGHAGWSAPVTRQCIWQVQQTINN